MNNNYFDYNMIQEGNVSLLQRFLKDFLAADVGGSKCLHAMSSNTLFCTCYIGKAIYHKFSRSDISYRFNGENFNIMLERRLIHIDLLIHIDFKIQVILRELHI